MSTVRRRQISANDSTPPKVAKKTPNTTPTRVTKKSPARSVVHSKRLHFEENEEGNDEMDTKENFKPFDVEDLTNEMASLTAIENYFLKGKIPQTNKSRRKRGKKNKRGEKEPIVMSEEEDTDDDIVHANGEDDAAFSECDLNALRRYYDKSRSRVSRVVTEQGKDNFPQWTIYLSAGFNVLVHGLGSLQPLLHSFAEEMGQEYTVFELESYRPDEDIRALLTAIHEEVTPKRPKKRSLLEWARQLVDETTNRDVILVVHNVDSANFREAADQEVLSILASSSHFRLVASVQHVNRMLIWNTRSIAAFRWVHVEGSTWLPAEKETFAGSSSLLGLSSSSSASSHSLASLDVLWQSLNPHARSIFHALFSLAYGSQDQLRDVRSVAFWDLFSVCKDNFWVSSDAALRQQLVEFSDHRLIRIRRGADGSERISAAAEKTVVERFLKEKNMKLEEMKVDEDEYEEEL